MNAKFGRLRDEVLAEFGLQPGDPPVDLPPLAAESVEPGGLEDRHVRFYSLWERLKHFRADDLDPDEAGVRDRLAAHVERGLTALHAAAKEPNRA